MKIEINIPHEFVDFLIRVKSIDKLVKEKLGDIPEFFLETTSINSLLYGTSNLEKNIREDLLEACHIELQIDKAIHRYMKQPPLIANMGMLIDPDFDQ